MKKDDEYEEMMENYDSKRKKRKIPKMSIKKNKVGKKFKSKEGRIIYLHNIHDGKGLVETTRYGMATKEYDRKRKKGKTKKLKLKPIKKY